ncbi:hypothetical protein QBC35DRAFT_554952 [Podospora australis]|uniref:Uncharacterized protein n=1 Tax=Podospora australis TaxID=1536484 RepID=A0AAN6WQ30_9PEZI|nr:hypothetical protein QBC35DRAFT_554952 [Podospora australis]
MLRKREEGRKGPRPSVWAKVAVCTGKVGLGLATVLGSWTTGLLIISRELGRAFRLLLALVPAAGEESDAERIAERSCGRIRPRIKHVYTCYSNVILIKSVGGTQREEHLIQLLNTNNISRNVPLTDKERTKNEGDDQARTVQARRFQKIILYMISEGFQLDHAPGKDEEAGNQAPFGFTPLLISAWLLAPATFFAPFQHLPRARLALALWVPCVPWVLVPLAARALGFVVLLKGLSARMPRG